MLVGGADENLLAAGLNSTQLKNSSNALQFWLSKKCTYRLGHDWESQLKIQPGTNFSVGFVAENLDRDLTMINILRD